MADDERLEEIVAELSARAPVLREEPKAFARALIRMGLERGIIEGIGVSQRVKQQEDQG